MTELNAWYQPLLSATLAVDDLNEHAAHFHSVRDRTGELVGLAVGIALNSATNGVIDPVCAAGHRSASGRTFPVGLPIRQSMVRIVADGLVTGRVAHNQNPPQGGVFPTDYERSCHCGTHPANSCHRMPSAPKLVDQVSPAPEAYLTTTDALKYLRTTPRTLYRHLAAGNIPAVRIGHQWRFKRDDLDRWLTAQAARPRETDRSDPPCVARRVLVVDDEPAVCRMLESILAVTDLEIDTAFDGVSALDRIQRTPYDLLFTDLVMPGLDGNELLRQAKAVQPDLKVVIVTGCPTQSSAIDAINIGVDGYLIKPFQPADVLAAAARAVGVAHDRSSTLRRAESTATIR